MKKNKKRCRIGQNGVEQGQTRQIRLKGDRISQTGQNGAKQVQTGPKGTKRGQENPYFIHYPLSLIENPLSSILYTTSIIPYPLYLILCAFYPNLHFSLIPLPLTLIPFLFLISLILYPSYLVSHPHLIPYPEIIMWLICFISYPLPYIPYPLS